MHVLRIRAPQPPLEESSGRARAVLSRCLRTNRLKLHFVRHTPPPNKSLKWLSLFGYTCFKPRIQDSILVAGFRMLGENKPILIVMYICIYILHTSIRFLYSRNINIIAICSFGLKYNNAFMYLDDKPEKTQGYRHFCAA